MHLVMQLCQLMLLRIATRMDYWTLLEFSVIDDKALRYDVWVKLGYSESYVRNCDFRHMTHDRMVYGEDL